jgi:hypothetical protein
MNSAARGKLVRLLIGVAIDRKACQQRGNSGTKISVKIQHK